MGKATAEIKSLTTDLGARRAGEYIDRLEEEVTKLRARLDVCCPEDLTVSPKPSADKPAVP